MVLAADEAFYGVLTATERRTIAESAQAVSAELLRAARVRLGNGEIPALDVGRLELEVAQATTAVDSAHTQLAIARNELATLIGVPESDLEVRPLQDEDGARPESLNDVVASAAASRPEVKRLDLEVQALESAVSLAHGARLPQLRAEAAAGWDSLTLPDGQNAGWPAGVTLVDPDRLAADVRFDDAAAQRVTAGQPATITPLEDQTHPLRTVVLRAARLLDPTSQRAEIWLQSVGNLPLGSFVHATVEVDTRESLAVPRSALVKSDTGYRVFVVADGIAHARAVEVGIVTDEHVEIRTGVGAGEMVASAGGQELADGMRVAAGPAQP